jgi:hypothetical protein
MSFSSEKAEEKNGQRRSDESEGKARKARRREDREADLGFQI